MTTVAIHQPNFFPWVGYFEKIARCDYFVFLDDVQYSKGALINRVEIETGVGKQYLTAPVNAPFGEKIKNINIAHDKWKGKFYRTLMWTYQEEPFYEKYIHDVNLQVMNREYNLSKYNINATIKLSELLGIKPKKGFLIQSEMDIPGTYEKTDLLIHIINHLDGTAYYSGVGALAYIDEEMFTNSNVELIFQNIRKFPTTSIIDILFRYGKRSIRDLIYGR